MLLIIIYLLFLIKYLLFLLFSLNPIFYFILYINISL
jgi:hypothetical protein